MTFRYVSVDEAIASRGLRMMVVGDVPSPWGEGAKGIFHIKGLDWAAVRMVYDSGALKAWAGQLSAPVAVFDDERPRSGWAEILLLAERLAPRPSLLPSDPGERAFAIGLAHEILGEAGLAWSRRLQLVHAGLANAGGFHPRAAKYLGGKYGYSADAGSAAGARVAALLRMLAARLKVQGQTGSRYYMGQGPTAVDIYSATVIALFQPLAPAHCQMNGGLRQAFESLDEETKASLDPILLEHRDMMYERHLELPLSL